MQNEEIQIMQNEKLFFSLLLSFHETSSDITQFEIKIEIVINFNDATILFNNFKNNKIIDFNFNKQSFINYKILIKKCNSKIINLQFNF